MTERLEMPKEDCTKEEAVAYLEQHIGDQNAEIRKWREKYDDADEAGKLRAWALDRAVRMLEKRDDASADDALTIAEQFRKYVEIKKPAELSEAA